MSKNGVVAAIAVALLMPGLAGAAQTVNRTVKFPKTQQRAQLGIKTGAITFTELIIRNPPKASDIREAQNDPDDNCHPKLALGVSNGGRTKMKFHVTVSLEDDKGNVYMSCERNDSISGGAQNDHTNLCWLDSMKTIDWPKLTLIRLVAELEADD